MEADPKAKPAPRPSSSPLVRVLITYHKKKGYRPKFIITVYMLRDNR